MNNTARVDSGFRPSAYQVSADSVRIHKRNQKHRRDLASLPTTGLLKKKTNTAVFMSVTDVHCNNTLEKQDYINIYTIA